MNNQRPQAPGMFPPQQPLQQGHMVVFPNPMPVSGRGDSVPQGAPVGNMGPEYGQQQYKKWLPGETKPEQVLDTLKAEALWRVSIFGNVTASILYGTRKNRSMVSLQAPVVANFPGQVIVTVTPRDDAGTDCVVTLTKATAGALSHARKLAVGAGTGTALDAGAVRYVALTASTLTISGVGVSVPALSSVPLVTGSVLLTGSGFQEFEA